MKKKTVIHYFLFALGLLVFNSCNLFRPYNGDNDIRFVPNTERVGVYWWDYWIINDVSYLVFAARNGITEIYLSLPNIEYVRAGGASSASAINNIINPTREFITRASEKGINVYLLLGNNGSWIRDASQFHRRMNGLRNFQDLAEPHERFAGVQLNVEPHQLRNSAGERYWDMGDTVRASIVQELADFAIMAHQTHNWIDICWAVTFWWDDRHMVNVPNRGNISLGEHLINLSNTVFVMGFRNTAVNMVNVSRYMIETAQRLGRDIVLLATVFEGNPMAEFAGTGREHMYEQLNFVQRIAGCSSVHVAIHHIVTWRHWERR